MSELICGELTVDSVFDACSLLDAIGVKRVLEIFDVGDQASTEGVRDIGIAVAAELCDIVIGNLPKAKDQTCKFFADCFKWDDKDDPVTIEDIQKMNITKFIGLIKEFFTQDDIADFFKGVAAFLGLDNASSGNLSTTDTATQQKPTY